MNRVNYCPNCKTENKTGKCQNCRTLPPIFVVDKRDNLTGKLIHDLKYSSVRALKAPLAELLDNALPEIIGNVTIVPLPTISKHIRARGLDHTYLISKHLARLRGKNYRVEKLLLRAKNTVQVGTDAKTRQTQAAAAYKIKRNAQINPQTTYILLDDVWTTGASMKAALKKLRSLGVKKVIIAILAVNRLD